MPLSARWLDLQTISRPSETRRVTPGLSAAVAAIVSLAAQRARAAGTLDALRDAIEAALEPMTAQSADPREADSTELPRIADADPAREGPRLRALYCRTQSG